jgi:hypothetical protein
MLKLIVISIAAVIAAGTLVVPATASRAKGKHVHETFGATLLPFPKDSQWEPAGFVKPGCTSGQEDVHWVAVEFTAPGNGTLRFWMEGFTGDHDIYVFQEELVYARSDQVQVGADMAPPEEEITLPMKKGQKYTLAACNWAGEPDVLAHYEGHFR